MNIDWSNAPADAEAGRAEQSGFLSAWYKKDAAGLVMQICQGAGVNVWASMGGRMDFPLGAQVRPMIERELKGQEECAHSEASRLGCPECGADFSRPRYVPKPWTGEGLPPEGLICEFARFPKTKEPKWAHVRILAHLIDDRLSGPVAVFLPLSGSAQCDQAVAECFRPIRTAEQIAAEKRKIAIWEMACDCGYGHNEDHGFEVSPIFAAAYDKGYRKQVQP